GATCSSTPSSRPDEKGGRDGEQEDAGQEVVDEEGAREEERGLAAARALSASAARVAAGCRRDGGTRRARLVGRRARSAPRRARAVARRHPLDGQEAVLALG